MIFVMQYLKRINIFSNEAEYYISEILNKCIIYALNLQ